VPTWSVACFAFAQVARTPCSSAFSGCRFDGTASVGTAGICLLSATRSSSGLVARGWLTPADRADVEKLRQRKLHKHQGDARASLAEVTSDPLRQSLASVADAEVQQSLAELPTRRHPSWDRRWPTCRKDAAAAR
jgi:hypothetical protein